MKKKDKELLIELSYGIISTEAFTKLFSVDIANDIDFVEKEMKVAIESRDSEEINLTYSLIELSPVENWIHFLPIMNSLLINTDHTLHQHIAKDLQDNFPHPTTVPYVKKVLEKGFDFLDYTGADDKTIAKWFSWLLYSIGNTEAIDIMKEYSNSPNGEIAAEMIYRLKKVDKNKSKQ